MGRIRVQLLCGILFTAFACAQEEVVVPDEPRDCYAVPATDYENIYTLARTWQLLWIENKNTTYRTYPPCPRLRDDNKFLVLKFHPDSNLCTGVGTINQFGGEYMLSESNGLSVHKIIQTLMGDTDEMVEFETRYLRALLEVTSYEIDHNFLILTYGNFGQNVLFFVAHSD
jgi:heat shock protein HslJ